MASRMLRANAIAGTLLLAMVAACATAGPPPPPREPASSQAEPVPPPSPRRGVVMPTDTGMSAGPTGTTSNTGTAGPAVGPTVGSAGAPN